MAQREADPEAVLAPEQLASVEASLEDELKGTVETDEPKLDAHANCLRKFLFAILMSHHFEKAMGAVIGVNFVVVIVETDNNAKEIESDDWVWYASWGLLTTFIFELSLKIYVLRLQFWHEGWNVFDFFVILVDTTFSLLEVVGLSFLNVSMLRILRLSRLARATKVFRMFPELKLMLAGLTCSFKAIFWGSVLLFVALLVWSVLAVQFIHPLNKEIAEAGHPAYDGCDRCGRAYESTFQACLTFTTQIVAGDSWGRETQPIIEEFPATAVFFLTVYVSVGLAIMNLILGVVVNVATEARERLMKEEENEKLLMANESLSALLVMCQEMDDDGNDELTFAEIREGFDTNIAFRETLADMDIGRDDLQIVWTILDSDKSGTVTSKEFVTQIYRMKNSDSQFMLAYIKFYITEIKDKLRGDLSKLAGRLNNDMDHLEQDVRANSAGISKQAAKVAENSAQIDANSKGIATAVSSLREDTFAREDTVVESSVGPSTNPVFTAPNGSARMDSGRAPQAAYSNGGGVAMATDSIDLLFQAGSLKELLENAHFHKFSGAGKEPASFSRDREPASFSRDPTVIKEPTEMLNRLEGVWQQCIVSIDDMRNFHMSLADMLESMIRRVSITIHHTVSASVSLSASKAPTVMRSAAALNDAASREYSTLLTSERSILSQGDGSTLLGRERSNLSSTNTSTNRFSDSV